MINDHVKTSATCSLFDGKPNGQLLGILKLIHYLNLYLISVSNTV